MGIFTKTLDANNPMDELYKTVATAVKTKDFKKAAECMLALSRLYSAQQASDQATHAKLDALYYMTEAGKSQSEIAKILKTIDYNTCMPQAKNRYLEFEKHTFSSQETSKILTNKIQQAWVYHALFNDLQKALNLFSTIDKAAVKTLPTSMQIQYSETEQALLKNDFIKSAEHYQRLGENQATLAQLYLHNNQRQEALEQYHFAAKSYLLASFTPGAHQSEAASSAEGYFKIAKGLERSLEADFTFSNTDASADTASLASQSSSNDTADTISLTSQSSSSTPFCRILTEGEYQGQQRLHTPPRKPAEFDLHNAL